MNIKTIIGVVSLSICTIITTSCQNDSTSHNSNDVIFEKGELAPSEKFVGNVYMNVLVPVDSIYTMKSGSVTFEAGARTNWHLHPSGQILMVTDGVGYHQIKGREREVIKKGDVIRIPPNVFHWHGASEEYEMTHLFMVPNIDKGLTEWQDPVTDQEYKGK
ncbi:cupin domain-containing protein [Fulvivirga maritima]|uniref:cupin domain-containing protein n=1 Tax=Fulvivirga maritima TaxID=2904247 RepID=UPI001F415240|nr:cupin domain-containing protein [Fulvivirga maritima]UII28331.1 cupin domain-containing protein [Fulvivirga maritima]